MYWRIKYSNAVTLEEKSRTEDTREKRKFAVKEVLNLCQFSSSKSGWQSYQNAKLR
jgi:hypothetical protein